MKNKAAAALGKLSAESRFKGMSKKEISEMMKVIGAKKWAKVDKSAIPNRNV